MLWTNNFANTTSFTPHYNPGRQVNYGPHFTRGETKAKESAPASQQTTDRTTLRTRSVPPETKALA